ncbi:MAG: GNAT family N-acetyltransferase [Acidobacteriaceae bacterium]
MWTLRAVERSDFESLYQLDQQCFAEGIAYSRADLLAFLSVPHSIALLAESTSGAMVGFIIAELRRKGEKRVGHIVTIDVAASMRRKGLGRALLFAVERRLREMGIDRVRLEVAVDNDGAQAFYDREGYERIGRIAGYYLDRIDAFVMEKRLEPGGAEG